MAYSAWSVVFGEQPSAAKWNILGTNDAYFDSLVGSGTAWAAWSPTLSGRLNDSKWTKAGTYQQFGKTVVAQLQLTANSATPMDGGVAEAIISLPVTATTPGSQYVPSLGTGHVVDGGVVFDADVSWNTTTTLVVRALLSSGTNVQPQTISSANPFTWASGDQIFVNIFYQAA